MEVTSAGDAERLVDELLWRGGEESTAWIDELIKESEVLYASSQSRHSEAHNASQAQGAGKEAEFQPQETRVDGPRLPSNPSTEALYARAFLSLRKFPLIMEPRLHGLITAPAISSSKCVLMTIQHLRVSPRNAIMHELPKATIDGQWPLLVTTAVVVKSPRQHAGQAISAFLVPVITPQRHKEALQSGSADKAQRLTANGIDFGASTSLVVPLPPPTSTGHAAVEEVVVEVWGGVIFQPKQRMKPASPSNPWGAASGPRRPLPLPPKELRLGSFTLPLASIHSSGANDSGSSEALPVPLALPISYRTREGDSIASGRVTLQVSLPSAEHCWSAVAAMEAAKVIQRCLAEGAHSTAQRLISFRTPWQRRFLRGPWAFILPPAAALPRHVARAEEPSVQEGTPETEATAPFPSPPPLPSFAPTAAPAAPSTTPPPSPAAAPPRGSLTSAPPPRPSAATPEAAASSPRMPPRASSHSLPSTASTASPTSQGSDGASEEEPWKAPSPHLPLSNPSTSSSASPSPSPSPPAPTSKQSAVEHQLMFSIARRCKLPNEFQTVMNDLPNPSDGGVVVVHENPFKSYCEAVHGGVEEKQDNMVGMWWSVKDAQVNTSVVHSVSVADDDFNIQQLLEEVSRCVSMLFIGI